MYGGISSVPRGIHDIQTCYTPNLHASIITATRHPRTTSCLCIILILHIWTKVSILALPSALFVCRYAGLGWPVVYGRWRGDQLFTVDLRARYVTLVQSHRYVTPDAPEPHNATATKPPHHMAHGHLFHQNGPYSSNLGLKVYYSSTFTFSP